jgi:predicted AAA+ superfamily ATPase
MKEFGKTHFEDCVYVSFYNNSRIAKIFEPDYDVRRILNALEIELRVKIVPEKTLLIFDEIQSVPKVLESLKYFCEDCPEYAVVVAGSLLGVAIHEGISFPVGKVNELWLHPMSFSEFLIALGDERLAAYIDNPENAEVNEFADLYRERLKQYYIVGGMPEVVNSFRENQDYNACREIQNSILNQYEGDFGKHVDPRELPRIRMVWNSLPLQLAKENRKFFFGQVKPGGRMKDFELAIQWLEDAGLIYKVNRVSKPGMPLKFYIDFSSFKLFMLDVGLLGAMGGVDVASVLEGNTIFEEFKGAMTEQYVLQQLISDTKYTPYYFAGEKSTYETDFLIQKGVDIVPLEVKAEENLRSKSLRVYADKYRPSLAVRTSMSGARTQDWMVNIPLWAISAL